MKRLAVKEIPCHKIRSIDLRPDHLIICSRWLDEEFAQPRTEYGLFGAHQVAPEKKAVGVPMRVLAVALPFITVELCHSMERGILDTREMEMIKVDAAYVNSLAPRYQRAEPEAVAGRGATRPQGTQVERYIKNPGKPGEWIKIVKER